MSDVVNPTLQIRHIGRRRAVALSSPMRPITADAPVSDVRHQHRSDTTDYSLGSWNNETSTVSRPKLPSARHSCDSYAVVGQIWRRQPMYALADDRRDSMTDRKPVKFTQHR